MGFTAGSDARVRPLAAAFTMVEVLLVIGMLVLIMGVAGLWIQRGLFATEERPPQEAFLAAAAQARVLAMQQGRPVLLVFDEQAQGFRLKLLDAQSPGGQEPYSGSLPWEEDRWRSGFSSSRQPEPAAEDATASGPANTLAQRTADSRFFALPQGSQLRVAFYLLYEDEAVSLPQPLEGIRYHPSGASTPVQVRMEDRGVSGFRLTLLPDPLSSGLRLDERGASANPATGGWR